MRRLLLVGGGGHCRSCIDVIEEEGRFDIAGIVQRDDEGPKSVLGYPVLGVDEMLPDLVGEVPDVLVTVGQIRSAATREKLFTHLQSIGAQFPVIVSPRAHVSKHASLDIGTIVMHGAIVNAGAQVGRNCTLNSLSLIEHDATVARDCHISTGARLNGGVTIGEGSFIGSGAILFEDVRVGPRCVIGAGQVVRSDVPAGTVLKSPK